MSKILPKTNSTRFTHYQKLVQMAKKDIKLTQATQSKKPRFGTTSNIVSIDME